MDARVEAIRKNELVGRGSCSSLDECFSDADLIEILDNNGITTVEGALKWALKDEEFFLEQGLNQRWGEDSDPQLKAYKEFKEKMEIELAALKQSGVSGAAAQTNPPCDCMDCSIYGEPTH